ncbi:MAG: sodium:solute symporter [Betaproteobacteria bacterium]|nr:sodium:solute symporter [Betaproteobacteria bacterium]
MSPHALLALIAGYFLLLLALAWFVSRGADNDSFFIGNRSSHWLLVAFGMIGTSLSGVTFISVPGTVGNNGFGYMQVVIGNWIGFMLIALILLPLYYRLKLTSIYDYLGQRFGMTAHKTGAAFFILSRTFGATARLYLVVAVLQLMVADKVGIPFAVSAGVILLMIWLYTHQGGVKTIVFTDTLQAAFMLGGLVVCVVFLADAIAGGIGAGVARVFESSMSAIWNADPASPGFWLKQIAGGAFIAIAMSGLDQEMMQKNISVPNIRDAQKNMFTFSAILVGVNLLFLVLGALLAMFASSHGVSARGDALFPAIVMDHFPPWVQAVFFIALISALFPSADGALTALTASFCLDILGLKQRNDLSKERQEKIRRWVHVAFAWVFLLLVLGFRALNDRSIIETILVLAGYTYGPLLGLFCFGMWTRRTLPQGWSTVLACVAAPVACYVLQRALAARPGGYQIGLELLVLNAALTMALLALISRLAVAADPRTSQPTP